MHTQLAKDFLADVAGGDEVPGRRSQCSAGNSRAHRGARRIGPGMSLRAPGDGFLRARRCVLNKNAWVFCFRVKLELSINYSGCLWRFSRRYGDIMKLNK